MDDLSHNLMVKVMLESELSSLRADFSEKEEELIEEIKAAERVVDALSSVTPDIQLGMKFVTIEVGRANESQLKGLIKSAINLMERGELPNFLSADCTLSHWTSDEDPEGGHSVRIKRGDGRGHEVKVCEVLFDNKLYKKYRLSSFEIISIIAYLKSLDVKRLIAEGC